MRTTTCVAFMAVMNVQAVKVVSESELPGEDMINGVLQNHVAGALTELPLGAVLGEDMAAQVEEWAADLDVDKMKDLFSTYKEWEGKVAEEKDGLLEKFNSFKKKGQGFMGKFKGAFKALKGAKNLSEIMDVINEENGAVDDFISFIQEEHALAMEHMAGGGDDAPEEETAEELQVS